MKQKIRYLSKKQVDKILDAAEDNFRHYLILLTLWRTGARASEVVNLQVSDIDFKDELVHIRNAKNDKERRVPLHDDLANNIRGYISDRSGDELVFKTRSDNKYSVRTIEYITHKYGGIAGIKVHNPRKENLTSPWPHVFRHSFAIHCLKMGMNLRYVQRMLGHSSLNTTQVYLDVAPTDIKDDFKEKVE